MVRGAAAVQVVAVAVDLEVRVARQEIGEEADADLERDQLSRDGQG